VDDDASGLTFAEWDPTETVRPEASSTRVNYVVLGSISRKCCLLNLRQQRVEAGVDEALGCCVLRAWAVSGMFFQQMRIQS